MWYNFDIIKYAQYVLRPSLRKRKIFAIISIFLLPLIFIYTLFKSYRKQAINKLNINGQVIYIEKVLNDRFFLKNREIREQRFYKRESLGRGWGGVWGGGTFLQKGSPSPPHMLFLATRFVLKLGHTLAARKEQHQRSGG